MTNLYASNSSDDSSSSGRIEHFKQQVVIKGGKITEAHLQAIISLVQSEKEYSELKDYLTIAHTEVEKIKFEIEETKKTYQKLQISLPKAPKLSFLSMIVMTFSAFGPLIGISWLLIAAFGISKNLSYFLTASLTLPSYIAAGVSLHHAAISDIGTKNTKYQERTFWSLGKLILTLDASVSTVTILVSAIIDNDSFDFASVLALFGVPVTSFLFTFLGIWLTWIDAKTPENKKNAQLYAAAQNRAIGDLGFRGQYESMETNQISLGNLNEKLKAAQKWHQEVNTKLSLCNKRLETATLNFQIALEIQPDQQINPVVFNENEEN